LDLGTAAILGLAACAFADAPYFASLGGLGDNSFPGFVSQGLDVSDDGSVGVGWSFRNFILTGEAFRWANGSMSGLGDLPGGDFNSRARAISGDAGTIVGGATSASGFEAYRWTAGSGMVGLGALPGGAYNSEALGVSSNGSTIVGYSGASGLGRAFVWTEAGGMVGLGPLPGGNGQSLAFDVSDDGRTIVGQAIGTTGDFEGVMWVDGAISSLGDLPGGGVFSTAVALSSDGSVITGQSESALGRETYVWTATGGMVGLGMLGPGTSFPNGISADGSTIVGSTNVPSGNQEAFIWDAVHGMRTVADVLSDFGVTDQVGWVLGNAAGVSADGRTIVGTGNDAQGALTAWIAHIPEPSSVLLLTLGGLAALSRRRS